MGYESRRQSGYAYLTSEGSVRVQCRVDPIPHWSQPLSILAFLVIRVKGEGAKPVYQLYGKKTLDITSEKEDML